MKKDFCWPAYLWQRAKSNNDLVIKRWIECMSEFEEAPLIDEQWRHLISGEDYERIDLMNQATTGKEWYDVLTYRNKKNCGRMIAIRLATWGRRWYDITPEMRKSIEDYINAK